MMIWEYLVWGIFMNILWGILIVSLLGTCGEQVMCCRYSCQNGHAILAQVLPRVPNL